MVLYLVHRYLTFLADLFFILNEIHITNYPDDNKPYTSRDEVNGLIKTHKKLQRVVEMI